MRQHRLTSINIHRPVPLSIVNCKINEDCEKWLILQVRCQQSCERHNADMVNKRPSPERIAALKLEIAQRYRLKAKEAKQHNRSRGMAAFRLAELTRWLDDAYGKGVELEATTQSYAIVRIFAHHIGALKDAPRRITIWAGVFAPWISPRDLERLINEVTHCQLKWTADKLAWKLKLTDAKRTELNIRTIGAIDCSREQRAERQRARRAQAERNRRELKRSTRVPHI